MGPIDYLGGFPQIDLGQKFLSGLQAGSAVGQLQQQADARALAMQQSQLAMQRQAQYQSDVSAALAAPRDQQAQLFGAIALRNPDQYEAITKGWGQLSSEQQKSELQDTFSIASSLHANRPDLALSQIDQRIAAAKNSNQPTADLEALRSVVEKDPEVAYSHVLHIASVLPGGDKVLANLSAIGKEQRDADKSESDLDAAATKLASDNAALVGQKATALAKPGVKSSQAAAFFRAMGAQGLIPKDQVQGYIDGIPTDPAAVQSYLAQVGAAGTSTQDQMKYTTPDANAQLQSDTSVKTTSMNNATSLATTRMNNATQLAVQDRIAARQDAKADTEASLNGDTLRSMAEQYVDGGDRTVLQNLGRGAQGAANLVALRAEITKVAKERGLSGSQIAAKLADYQGLTAGIRTSAQISARVENAIAEAKELAPLAIAAGQKVSRSGILPFGKAQIMFDTQTNNAALKEFATANNGLVTAYAGAMSRGQKPTQALFDHAQKMLTEAQDQKSYEAAVGQMYKEMDAASRAPQKVREHLRGEIGGSGAHGATTVPNPVAAPAIPSGWSVREH